MNPNQMNPQQSQQSSPFLNAWNFAKQNPTNPASMEFAKRIQSGDSDILNMARQSGYDLSSLVKKPVTPPTPQTEPGFMESLSKGLEERGRTVGQALVAPSKATSYGDFVKKVGEAGLVSAGEVAGGIGDFIGEGVKAITPKPVKDVLGWLAEKTGFSGTAQQLAKNWEQFAQTHPNAARDLGEVFNIATLVGGAKGAEAAKVPEKLGEIGAKATGAIEKAGTAAKGVFVKTPEELAAASAKRATEAITPKVTDLTPTEYGDMLRAGKITPKTATQEAKYVLQPEERTLVQKYAPYLQSGDVVKDTNNVLTQIINKDTEVGSFLAKNPKVYVKTDLENALKNRLSQVSDITIPKENLSEARKDLLDTVMSRIPESNTGRTYDKLWEFRKEFDQSINNKLNAFSGSPTLKKDMARALRNGIQDFIGKAEPKYSPAMKEMSDMYKIIDMLETKATKERSLTGIQALIKANPKTAAALKYAGYGLLGAGIAGETKNLLGL